MRTSVLLLLVLTSCDYAARVPPHGARDTTNELAETSAPDVDLDAPVPDCAAIEPADFRDTVLVPILQGGGCIVCHRSGGRAGGSDLVLVGGEDDAAVATDLASAEVVANKTVGGESVLLLRPTGRYPDGHPGGEPITLDSPTYEALARFVSAARSCATSPDGHAPVGGVH